MSVARIARPHSLGSANSPNSLECQAITSREKISCKPSIAGSGTSSAANSLHRSKGRGACGRSDGRRKALSRRSLAAKAGWSAERRARQAALIRTWAPWRRSTGPKTETGKARCSQNALKHGYRSRATIGEYQKIRHVLRLAARNIAILRAHIRARDQSARPQIRFKPWYARALAFAKADCPSPPPGAIAPA